MNRQYYVYILTNYQETTFYTGVTNDLVRRVYEHKNKVIKSYTSRYNINKLVYYEIFEDIEQAIKREKQIKGGSRKQKIVLVNNMNPDWKDLYEEII